MSAASELVAPSPREEKRFERVRLVRPKAKPEHSVDEDQRVADASIGITSPPADPVAVLPMHEVMQLLRSPTPRHSADVNIRASAASRVQETHGNRFVQRFMGAQVLQRQCACGGSCAKCQEEEQRTLQRSSAAAAPAEFDGIPTTHGEPLDATTRRPLEAHFGADLADVRVHTGSEAVASATRLDALAYTSGRDIYFGAGMYSPASISGQRLLAHEVAHVVQQDSGKEPTIATKSASGVKIGAPDDILETEAERAAEQFISGTPGELTDEEQRKRREPETSVQRFIQRQDAGAPAPAPAAGKETDLDAGVPPSTSGTPPDISGPLNFEGLSLTADSGSTVVEIEKYVEGHGLDACPGLGQRFESELATLGYNEQDKSGAPDPNDREYQRLTKMKEVAPVFRLALTGVVRQSNEFLATFDARAHEVLSNMLAASQERILSERQRYGLTATTTEKTRWTHDEGAKYKETVFETSYGIGSNNATTGLQKAAKALADKARNVRSMMDARNKLMPISASEFGPTEEEWAPYKAADEKVQKAVGEYNVLRFQSDKDYPILAAFDALDTTGTWYVDRTISQLTGLANRSSKDTAGTLYEETAEKLANIDKVTTAVAEGDLKVWKLPSVVSLTLQQMDTLPAAMEKRLADDKAAETSPGEILDIALGVLAIALGALAAIPTGGSSLAAGIAVAAGVGSAALGGYFAIEHIQQYTLEAAANGTDFEKARAVSQTEPSLFWLAVDIIGAIGGAAADIHAAAATFKALSTSLREASELRQLAQEGQRVAEADAAVARLKQEGDAVAKGLGEKLAAKVGKEGIAVEKEAALTVWEDSMNPESRAFLVDNPGVRTVYSDMDEEMRWLCTHCSKNCLIEGLTRAQSQKIQAMAEALDKEQLEALRDYLHLHKDNVDGVIAEMERELNIRAVHAEEQHPEIWGSRRSKESLSEHGAPDVAEGQRLPRGKETPDPELGGFWGGEVRGDGPYFSDIPEVNEVTGYRPIEFHNGFPDFSPWARERVAIPVTGIDSKDFALADEILAKRRGFNNMTAYKNWRSANALTWHHVEGAEEMILVPRALHENVPHVGGASQARTSGAAASTASTP